MRKSLVYWATGGLLLLGLLGSPLAAAPVAARAEQPAASSLARAAQPGSISLARVEPAAASRLARAAQPGSISLARVEQAAASSPARGGGDSPQAHFAFSVLGQTTGTATATPTATATATATITPVATGTPIGGTGIVPTTQNVPGTSGLAGVACASTVGQTCTITGSAFGTITVTGSTSFTLTASGPTNALVGGFPAVFIPTTFAVEAFQCSAVTSAFQTTCTGATIGNPLQAATITVRFPLVGGATADVFGLVNLGATATTSSVPLATALTLVARSGQTGIPCASGIGTTCTATGTVTGSGNVTSSMTWSLTVTIPASVAAGTIPVAVFTTTVGLEGFTCTAVAVGATTVTCTGTTAGNALQGSTVTVLFTTALTAVGTITGNGANLALLGSAVPPLLPFVPSGPLPTGPLPIGGAPLLGGPLATGPIPPFGSGPPVAANVGVRAPFADVPVIPEADPGMLLVAGLSVVGLVGWWRTRRDEVASILAGDEPAAGQPGA